MISQNKTVFDAIVIILLWDMAFTRGYYLLMTDITQKNIQLLFLFVTILRLRSMHVSHYGIRYLI